VVKASPDRLKPWVFLSDPGAVVPSPTLPRGRGKPVISKTIKHHPELNDVDVESFLDFYWNESVSGASLVTLDNMWLCPNPKMCSLLGYPASRLEEMTWMDVTVEPDRKEDLEAVASVIRGEVPRYVMDKTYISRQGMRVLVRLTAVPIRYKDQRVAMFFSQVQEVEGIPVQAPDELRVISNFLKNNRKTAISIAVFYTVAVGLAGDGAIRWVMAIFDALRGINPA
jgi:PAS domain S-box-containing protein